VTGVKIIYNGRVYDESDVKELLADFYRWVLDQPSGLKYSLIVTEYSPEADRVYLDIQPMTDSEDYKYTRDYRAPSVVVWSVGPLDLDPFEGLEWDEDAQAYRDWGGELYSEDEVIDEYVWDVASEVEDQFRERLRETVNAIKRYMGVFE